VHTISRALVAACAQGLTDKGHSVYYRFLSQARWSVPGRQQDLDGMAFQHVVHLGLERRQLPLCVNDS